jgi:small-conductance mechanosensitive channel
MSRDYIITKLDFRVKYDTDVDKVRKIIKKINKKLAKDPEISKVLLGKVKSQGIRELDDSAMIMRVKFKTLPGEQFVIRRHVFHMMQQAFKDAGIEFAHRNVTVYLPPEQIEQVTQSGARQTAQPESASTPGQPAEKKAAAPMEQGLAKMEAVAGAAAAAVIQAEEAAKQQDEKK